MGDRKAPADDWGLDPYTSAEITHTHGGTMSIEKAKDALKKALTEIAETDTETWASSRAVRALNTSNVS